MEVTHQASREKFYPNDFPFVEGVDITCALFLREIATFLCDACYRKPGTYILVSEFNAALANSCRERNCRFDVTVRTMAKHLRTLGLTLRKVAFNVVIDGACLNQPLPDFTSQYIKLKQRRDLKFKQQRESEPVQIVTQ